MWVANRRLNRVEALIWAGGQVKHPSRDWTGRCQEFTRKALDVHGGFPSALSAWRGVAKRDRNPSRTPPAGVPVYWKGGKYGHAAVSAGGGYVFSTDIKRRGKVDRVPLDLIEARWEYEYLGWARTVNGVRVYGGDPK